MDWPSCSEYLRWLREPSQYVAPELTRWLSGDLAPEVLVEGPRALLVPAAAPSTAEPNATIRMWHTGAEAFTPQQLVDSWNAVARDATDRLPTNTPSFPPFLLRVLDVIPAAIGPPGGPRFPAVVHEWPRGTGLENWNATVGPPRSRGSFEGLYAQVLDLITWLAQTPAVHGELHPDQLLVTDAGVLRLIDFDAFQIGPSTTTSSRPRPGDTSGHPFPSRKSIPTSADLEYSDYRAALYLLASLKASSLDQNDSVLGVSTSNERPCWPRGDELAAPWSSHLLSRMLDAKSPELRKITCRLLASLETRADELPTLAEARPFFDCLERPIVELRPLAESIAFPSAREQLSPSVIERDEAVPQEHDTTLSDEQPLADSATGQSEPEELATTETWVAEEDDDLSRTVSLRLPVGSKPSEGGLVAFSGLAFALEDLPSTWRQAAGALADELSSPSSSAGKSPATLPTMIPAPTSMVVSPSPPLTGTDGETSPRSAAGTALASITTSARLATDASRSNSDSIRGTMDTSSGPRDAAPPPATVSGNLEHQFDDPLLSAIQRGDDTAARQLFSPQQCRKKIQDKAYGPAERALLVEWAKRCVRDLNYLEMRAGPIAFRPPVDGAWQLVWHGPRPGFCDHIVVGICREQPQPTATPHETPTEFANRWESASHTVGALEFKPEWADCFITIWAVMTLGSTSELTLYSHPLVLDKRVPAVASSDSDSPSDGDAAERGMEPGSWRGILRGFFGR